MDLSTRYKLLLRTEGAVDEAESKVNANKDTINKQQQRIAVYSEQHELSFEANAAAESTRLEKNLVMSLTEKPFIPTRNAVRTHRQLPWFHSYNYTSAGLGGSCFPRVEIIPIGYQAAVVTRGG